MVRLNSNQNAKLHFSGPNHRNKVMLVFNRKNKENLIVCDVCCCELNTPEMLEIHKKSPKHLKKVEAHDDIMKLKEEFMKNMNSDQNKSKNENENENIVQNENASNIKDINETSLDTQNESETGKIDSNEDA